MWLARIAFLFAVASPTFAEVKEVWWNLTYVANANPDGLYERRVVGVNGTWPPPPIDVTTNDTLVVHTLNSLSEPSSLHHHGMFFNASTWFDGAQSVSQWESHSYDAEYTVILGDWYHAEHSTLLKHFISIANPGGAEPVPGQPDLLLYAAGFRVSPPLFCPLTDSALIYFAQNGSYLGPVSGTSPSSVTSHVGFNKNATLPFEPGKTYRLRIVNTSAFAAFFFWIDGHDMRIIEADGTDVEESPIDLLSLTVAQRYSLLVTARNDSSSNWAIHANMDTDMFDTVPGVFSPANITASITYNSSAPVTDLGVVGTYHDVNDTALVPVVVQPMLPVDRTIELEVSFDTMTDGTNRAMFNQISYQSPLVPTVERPYSRIKRNGGDGIRNGEHRP
ncbi:Cupredoxin [Russula brevipes]|nr:Cupredoxin [Russula brevipes]